MINISDICLLWINKLIIPDKFMQSYSKINPADYTTFEGWNVGLKKNEMFLNVDCDK